MVSSWVVLTLYVGLQGFGLLDVRLLTVRQLKEELENDADFLKDYSVPNQKGGPAAPEAQAGPA